MSRQSAAEVLGKRPSKSNPSKRKAWDRRYRELRKDHFAAYRAQRSSARKPAAEAPKAKTEKSKKEKTKAPAVVESARKHITAVLPKVDPSAAQLRKYRANLGGGKHVTVEAIDTVDALRLIDGEPVSLIDLSHYGDKLASAVAAAVKAGPTGKIGKTTIYAPIVKPAPVKKETTQRAPRARASQPGRSL